MRTVGPRLVLLVALAVPGIGRAARPDVCQQHVATGAAKFAQSVLKLGQRCAMRAAPAGLACRIGSAVRSGDQATDDAVARAAARLAARVGDACANADLSAYAAR